KCYAILQTSGVVRFESDPATWGGRPRCLPASGGLNDRPGGDAVSVETSLYQTTKCPMRNPLSCMLWDAGFLFPGHMRLSSSWSTTKGFIISHGHAAVRRTRKYI